VPLVPVPFTTYPGFEASPSFSPDGNQVAFAWNGEKQDNFDIYIKQIASGSNRRLTLDPNSDFDPAWSPDGQFIAFLRDLGRGKVAVMMIPANGGRERQVVELQRQDVGGLQILCS
jgi:Tol biopolymer transport system component